MDINQLYGVVTIDGQFDQASIGNRYNVYVKEVGETPTAAQLEAYVIPDNYVKVKNIDLGTRQPAKRYEYYSPKPVELIDGEWTLDYELKRYDEESIILIEKNAGIHLLDERFRELAASDWTQLPNAPLTPEKKAEWATYRQAWRDITTSPDYPHVQRPLRPGKY